MSDTAWLIVAAAAAVLVAAAWIAGGLAIHRGRRQRSHGEETKV